MFKLPVIRTDIHDADSLTKMCGQAINGLDNELGIDYADVESDLAHWVNLEAVRECVLFLERSFIPSDMAYHLNTDDLVCGVLEHLRVTERELIYAASIAGIAMERDVEDDSSPTVMRLFMSLRPSSGTLPKVEILSNYGAVLKHFDQDGGHD
ncbi:hypothetical protein QCE62_05615 [Caballeronia sp. LZ033]|uniref:hypothetical protein n=1 Tax=Caballeronia sp. LZ033 TaxID=3038566 RepID=UPI002862FA16|nr:hypothetical protein [Caballeronia sp. LZ033]MDR5813067.1 hypothetical protein [Caballeronia sp. LZ033]